MSRAQSAAEDARNAMVAGLLASGISVNGLQPSHNPQVASQMFNTATTVDPGMCDAWLARVLAGEHFDALITCQHPRQPCIAHPRINAGSRGEHLRCHLRIVAWL